MAICDHEMVSLRLETKIEETWQLFMRQNLELLHWLRMEMNLYDKVPVLRVIVHEYGPIFPLKTL